MKVYDKVLSFLWCKKYIFLFFGLFIILLTQRFLSERQNGLANTLYADGTGYYAYLPAAIIYQDFTYSFLCDQQNGISPNYYFKSCDNRNCNKCYCGTAICLLPFFLVGILISFIAGTDINGYTDTFLMLVSIAPIVYYLLSVFLISKITKVFFISEKLSFAVCLIFLFGTNLYHYIIQEPSMSHVYSFFAVSLFLYTYLKLQTNVSVNNLCIVSASLALVCLIRPTNIVIVLFIPFFSQNVNAFLIFLKSLFSEHFLKLFLAFLFFLVIVSLQFILYYLQVGSFFINAYQGESFNFLNPEIFNVLFSYRKGLFIYTPLLFACFFMIVCVRGEWYKKTVFFIFFFVFLYITASWWCWYYGGSYGNRPFIDIYPLFIILCLFLLNRLKVNYRKLVLVLSFPFVFLNQVMAFQISNLLMDKTNMNKDKFWDIFLKVDLASVNERKINEILNSKKIIKTDFLSNEGKIDYSVKKGGYKSNNAILINRENEYSKGFVIPLKNLDLTDSCFVIAECMVKANMEAKDLELVVSIDENGECKKWDVVFKNQFSENNDGWAKMTIVSLVEKELMASEAVLKIFAHTGKGEALVDDLKCTILKN